ncbi:helix-turn-helix transcriptional regulator [Bacillus solitudinis]|uniref:helix-turn-helix transcriptional regulator n=1 Tax=Bacillus solitudinis TaxID=2014074 RepID=UPI0018E27E26
MREWLLDARKKRDITQAVVADAVGIKREYYTMIENGVRTPSVENAMKIAGVLKVDWTMFFSSVLTK